MRHQKRRCSFKFHNVLIEKMHNDGDDDDDYLYPRHHRKMINYIHLSYPSKSTQRASFIIIPINRTFLCVKFSDIVSRIALDELINTKKI